MNLSDNLYCCFCKSSYENVIHVFSECNVIQKLWSKLKEWIFPELGLTALSPQNAILPGGGGVFGTTLEVFAHNSEREKDNSTKFGDFSWKYMGIW